MGCGSSIARPSESPSKGVAKQSSLRPTAAAAGTGPAAPAPPLTAPEPRPAAQPPPSLPGPAPGPSPSPSQRCSPGAPAQAVNLRPPGSVPGSRPASARSSQRPAEPGSARKALPPGGGREPARADPQPPSEAATAAATGEDDDPRERARELTAILAQRLKQDEDERRQQLQQRRSSVSVSSFPRSNSPSHSRRGGAAAATAAAATAAEEVDSAAATSAGGGGSLGGNGGGAVGGGDGFGAEVEALLLGGADRFQALLKDMMMAQTQVLLPGNADPGDAAAITAVTACSPDQAVRLLDCLNVVRAAADALAPPPTPQVSASVGAEPTDSSAAVAEMEPDLPAAAVARATAAGSVAGPSPQQLTRQLGYLAGLVGDVPGLRTAAMARDAAKPLLRVMLHHTEKAAAANAALALAALAAGPPPHKAALVAAGVVEGLMRAATGRTAAAANAGDAPAVAANACSALGNLATGHAAGAAAVAAGGAGGGGSAAAAVGIETLLRLVAVDGAPNLRTNAAGVLVQLTAAHESYRAAVALAGGGVAALAAGALRGPDAAACNAVTALYNLAALTPPSLRPAMARAEGPLAIVPQLLLCMSGCNAAGAADESVAAAAAARVNASAVLLELCKDSAAAPSLAEPPLAVPAALAALAAGRLPPPPPLPAVSTAAAGAVGGPAVDVLAGGVDLLYPVPLAVRSNCLLGLMALARMGPVMQLELGRCGALGSLLELLGPGQDPAMQVNSANAICSLAAANADIHSALVAARCVPLLAGLLAGGGDAARANVAAVLVTMMRDPEGRRQILECGALTSLIRLAAALLDERAAAGCGGGAASCDPGGVLCNAVGALAEAARYPELRRGLMQAEFGESLETLLRCLREAAEPAQVNAAAALCHLSRDQAAAVQLGRLRGFELLREAVGAHPDEGSAPGGSGGWTRPSSRLRHNASRALARLQGQLAAAEEEEAAAAAARAIGRAVAAAAAAGGQQSGPAAAPSDRITAITADNVDDDDAAVGRGGTAGAEVRSGRLEPPREGCWGLFGGDDTPLTAVLPTAAASRTFDAVVSYEDGGADDDDDDVSTVITPPLPLAAF